MRKVFIIPLIIVISLVILIILYAPRKVGLEGVFALLGLLAISYLLSQD
jgi:hypothetical protein